MLPTFIVIGAAKAGTTALYWYLAEHPAVFMSPVKETNFFAYGVDGAGQLLYGIPELHHFPVTTLSDYEKLFANAGDAAAVGEASPIYLECPQAAGRIRTHIPDARLICGLRHPVDRAYSDYLMYLRLRGERLEPARDLVASARWAQPDSHWMQLGRYREQLQRYYTAFPEAQIHIFLFDDLRRDLLGTVQAIYRFVGVEPSFVPDLETPHNIGGMPASRQLEQLFSSSTLRRAVGPLVPQRAARWVRRLRARNMVKAPPLPSELRQELTQRFQHDIIQTSRLIGRSLEHWL